MPTILRFVGLLNAAIWLGGAVFFSFVAAPGLFQPAMKRLFHDYYVGTVAQMLQERYFAFHLTCAAIALLHALALRFSRRGESSRLILGLVCALCLLSGAGAFGLVPTMKALFQTKYTSLDRAQREKAAASFRRWHGLAQGLNLVVLGGLVFYVWRMGGPASESRLARPNPFGGGAPTAERVG